MPAWQWMDMSERIAVHCREPLPERKEFLDVLALRQHHALGGLDDVVKAQRQPLMRSVFGKIGRLGKERVEDRQDVRHRRVLESAKLLQPAYGQTAL